MNLANYPEEIHAKIKQAMHEVKNKVSIDTDVAQINCINRAICYLKEKKYKLVFDELNYVMSAVEKFDFQQFFCMVKLSQNIDVFNEEDQSKITRLITLDKENANMIKIQVNWNQKEIVRNLISGEIAMAIYNIREIERV